MSDPLENEAVRLLASGNAQEAKELFLSSAELMPERYAYYLCWAARASIMLGQQKNAITEFRKAIEHDHTMFSLLHFAQYLIDIGEHSAAKRQLAMARNTNRQLLNTTAGEQYEARLFYKVESQLAE